MQTTAASRLLVSADAPLPHLILAVETSLQCLLGYAPHELVGKDIRILQGIETDTGLLNFVMENNTVMQSQIILYERHGLPAVMDASCEPLFSISQNRRCILMDLVASDILTLGQALGITACPYALLSAEWPHRIETVNQQYAAEFGVEEQDIVNKDSICIKPADFTDSLWQALIDTAALEGRRAMQREIPFVLPSGGTACFDVHFAPVIVAPNRNVEHILVRFSRLRAQPSHSERSDIRAFPAPQPATPDAAVLLPWLASMEARPSREALPQHTTTRPTGRPGRQAATPPLIIDEAYIRRLRRRHKAAARRSAPEARGRGGSCPPPPLCKVGWADGWADGLVDGPSLVDGPRG